MSTKKNIKGFTIIEVVLVLAIAGLIFLMVFVALPALQAGQRDTARKTDVSSVAAAVNSYSSANRGKLPGTGATLGSTIGQGYLEGVSTNITSVTVAARTTAAVSTADGVINVITQARCPATMPAAGTTSITMDAGSARQYAVLTLLEGNGKTVHCLEG